MEKTQLYCDNCEAGPYMPFEVGRPRLPINTQTDIPSGRSESIFGVLDLCPKCSTVAIGGLSELLHKAPDYKWNLVWLQKWGKKHSYRQVA